MTKVLLLLGLLAAVILLGVAEAIGHRRNLKRIPIRIHVNGTRGKSSVTRLLAGGLQAGGIVTCAKTTGSAAAMILPDGSEYAIHRPAGPNIIEQVRIVDAAVEAGAEALVVECMAVQPLLQSLCELKLVKATLGVITNVRADHLDAMGPEESDVARALAGTIPVEATLFTATEHQLGILQEAARDRGTKVEVVSRDDVDTVTDQELAAFSHLEHRENVALALRVCAALGVEREVALRGMQAAAPDPGALTMHELDFFGRRIFFANGLAANDPESTERIWTRVLAITPDVEKRIALFNCRVDRPDRSRQLGEACVDWPAADHYVLMGTGTYFFARAAARCGLDVRKLVIAENRPARDVFESLIDRSGRSTLIMGMGNFHGGGEELARLFRNRGSQRDLHAWS